MTAADWLAIRNLVIFAVAAWVIMALAIAPFIVRGFLRVHRRQQEADRWIGERRRVIRRPVRSYDPPAPSGSDRAPGRGSKVAGDGQ